MSVCRSAYYLFFLLVYLVSYFNTSFTCFVYEINKEEITLSFCENKDKPQLACNGKCFLMKQLSSEKDNDKPKILDNRVAYSWIVSSVQQINFMFFGSEDEVFSHYTLLSALYEPSIQYRPPQV